KRLIRRTSVAAETSPFTARIPGYAPARVSGWVHVGHLTPHASKCPVSAQNHLPSSWTCIRVFRRIGEVMPPEGVQSQLQCLGSGFWADGRYLDDGIEDIPSWDARHIVHHDKYVKPGRPPEMGFWGTQRQRLCPLNGLNHIFPQANPAKH